MRKNMGRPDAAIVAAVTLSGEGQPMGHVITLMSKAPAYSKTPEMRHIAASTYDPAKRREKALQFFSEAYYQNSREFSDEITTTFPPDSAVDSPALTQILPPVPAFPAPTAKTTAPITSAVVKLSAIGDIKNAITPVSQKSCL